MKWRKSFETFLGFFVFFITVSVTVTVAVLTYAWIGERSGWDKNAITWVMFGVILLLSSVAASIEFLRHKWTVEKNVEEILHATERIAEGDFEVRLTARHSFSAYDDFDRIKENLNLLAKELSKTEMLRSDFVSAVSHEIKTPLSVIRSYASALEKGGLNEETRTRYVNALVTASDKLSTLVTNVLKLNRLENSELLPAPVKVNITASLEESLLGFTDKIDEKGIVLSLELEEGVNAYLPEGYAELIWNNLLSNAVKFTGSGGKISVVLKREKGWFFVRVSDSGIGIDPEQGKHIFEKFYQGDSSHAQEGNGLGLALVKKVVDLIGGEIEVESVLGKGTTFTVRIRGEE